ncbi:hypothetical protein, partial [Virgibacillus chiguensis]|uniref:hypothetical protein n=1 Tax=Virgibacillus chiguensis TaxID=411959 RepID=UPI001BAF1EDC
SSFAQQHWTPRIIPRGHFLFNPHFALLQECFLIFQKDTNVFHSYAYYPFSDLVIDNSPVFLYPNLF